MTTVFRRMFSIKYDRPLAGIRKRTEVTKEDTDNFDADDISELEADFMNIGESHKMHEREIWRKKENLKQQIVIKKYFKEKEPRFITFAEKELICKLHESDPDEWTVEKLSESFPALPEMIQKILHVKWSPASTKKVIQYDNIAVQNWKKFRAGKLPLDPMFREHLMKFKDRKINLIDRESLVKQFVPPKTDFQKPKSQLFSSIVQIYSNENKSNAKLLSQEDNTNKVADTSNNSDKIQYLPNTNTRIDNSPKEFALNEEQCFTLRLHTDPEKSGTVMPLDMKKNEDKLLTFDEFAKMNLKDIQKESPEEGITLLNIRRKQMDASQEMQTAEISIVSNDTAISTHKREDTASKIVENSDSISAVSKNKDGNSDIVTADDNLLDTRIKVWNKKVDIELSYTKPIKIAKHLYKSGMTYRINDCYYDDDGEFLYRVPGVQN